MNLVSLAPAPDLSLAMTWGFTLLLIASMCLKYWLSVRQIRYVMAHRAVVPEAFAQHITPEAHQKAADYTVAKERLGLLELAWGSGLTIGWTLLGGLNMLNHSLLAWMPTGLAQQVLLLVAFTAIGFVLELPFTLYNTFVLEQRFGFNTMTLRLWLQDLLKSSIIAAVIGIPLISLVVWMMGATGPNWWLWTAAVWIGFNLLMLLIYPTWIAPRFNQFKPLEDSATQSRVSALMARCGFTSKGFYVMDGSKRSAHANAYFTGFGASKRVVFYDTLLNQLDANEIDAVLAHELGHFKHGHIRKRLLGMFAMSVLGFMLLGYVSQQTWFYTGLGVTPNLQGDDNALVLLLFMMVLPLIGTFSSPLFAQLSRKHEFEADAYAVEKTSASGLASALLKLYQGNASTLTPDPLYVKFYYSHPSASERLGRLGGVSLVGTAAASTV